MSAIATTKLSSKGQVVIPEEIRSRLGLVEGTSFVVLAEGDVVVLKTIAPPQREEFAGLLRQARAAARRTGMRPADIERATELARKQR